MRRFSIVLAVSLFCVLPYYGSTLNAQTTVILTGDILLDRGVREAIDHRGVEHLFSKGVDSMLRSAQIVVGNLECPATTIKAPVFKRYIFRGEPEWLTTLRKHGFTHLNLANNHSIDQGREGLIDTRRNVERAGMVPIGAGRTMQEAAQPVLLNRRASSSSTNQGKPGRGSRNIWLIASLRLALENYSYLPDKPCVSQEPMDSLLKRVRRLRQSDSKAVIIVSLHWGGEHTLKPVPRQRLEAHSLIDAGADVLVCHHTHTLQTIEEYRGHKIYYSIGNFIFDQQRPLNSEACMVRLTVGNDSLDVETIPVTIRKCVPYIKRREARE